MVDIASIAVVPDGDGDDAARTEAVAALQGSGQVYSVLQGPADKEVRQSQSTGVQCKPKDGCEVKQTDASAMSITRQIPHLKVSGSSMSLSVCPSALDSIATG